MQMRQRGFSLVELLVVMIIIAVLTAAVTLSFRDSNDDQIRVEARRFAALIKLVQDEAILRSLDIGIRVEEDHYKFLLFDGERWLPVTEDPQLTEHKLREPLELFLKLEGEPITLGASDDEEDVDIFEKDVDIFEEEDEQPKVDPPQIVILSNGEITPFYFAVAITESEERPRFYRVGMDYGSKVTVEGMIDGHPRQLLDAPLEEEFDRS